MWQKAAGWGVGHTTSDRSTEEEMEDQSTGSHGVFRSGRSECLTSCECTTRCGHTTPCKTITDRGAVRSGSQSLQEERKSILLRSGHTHVLGSYPATEYILVCRSASTLFAAIWSKAVHGHCIDGMTKSQLELRLVNKVGLNTDAWLPYSSKPKKTKKNIGRGRAQRTYH